MTFSILALDQQTGAIGGAAATGNLAVGAWVLRAAAKSGAVATQGASTSSLWGDEALARLSNGECAEQVVDGLTEPDLGRDHRQLAVLDRHGGPAAWTGSLNTQTRGHLLGENYVVAGNWLSNDTVLTQMEAAYKVALTANEMEFGRCLLAALQAGLDAGSDSRGTLSAAIKIVHPSRSPLDLRVDYDQAPLARLKDLYLRATTPPYSDWAARVPTLEDPYRC